ncbi:MAG: hypothetical protein AB7G37_17760 [Solirubrobacteraceae bacterium]
MPTSEQLRPHADLDRTKPAPWFHRTGLPIVIGLLVVAVVVLLIVGSYIGAIACVIAIAGIVLAGGMTRAMDVSEQDREDEADQRRRGRRTGDWS